MSLHDIGVIVLLSVCGLALLIDGLLGFVGSAVRQARDNGWHPDKPNPHRLVIRHDHGTGWVEHDGETVWSEAGFEAENILREQR